MKKHSIFAFFAYLSLVNAQAWATDCELHFASPPARWVEDLHTPDFNFIKDWFGQPAVLTSEPMNKAAGRREQIDTPLVEIVDFDGINFWTRKYGDPNAELVPYPISDNRRIQIFPSRIEAKSPHPRTAIIRIRDFRTTIGQRFRFDLRGRESIVGKLEAIEPPNDQMPGRLVIRTDGGSIVKVRIVEVKYVETQTQVILPRELLTMIQQGKVVEEFFAFPLLRGTQPIYLRGRVVQARENTIVIRFRDTHLRWHDRTIDLRNLDPERSILKLS